MITNNHVVAQSTYPSVHDAYVALRLALLKQFEAASTQVYFDTAQRSNPTIGIGLNLNDDEVRNRFFDTMGITNSVIRADILDILTDPIILALPAGEDIGERTYVMRAALDYYLILNPLAAVYFTATQQPTFTLTQQQVESTFGVEADYRESNVITGVQADTYERLAVLSAQLNGLYGDKLKAAIAADNRAEAWFELRYGWDDTKVGTATAAAFAKRRFAEAALFGLYDTDGISSEEAGKVFRMLTSHRQRIEHYEATYAAAAIASGNANLTAEIGDAASREPDF
jgi:hypothetical protein